MVLMLVLQALSVQAIATGNCGSMTPHLPGYPDAEATCNDGMDMYMGDNQPLVKIDGSDSAAVQVGPAIPKPSTTCGRKDVVVGWCLQNAPLTHTQPWKASGSYTDAECCALCVAEPSCVVWNTNSHQNGTSNQGCHFRAGLGTPNESPACHFGVTRKPPPLPPPPPPIKPAPKGAKNLLAIVCDDFRPWIKPFTDKYGIRVRLYSLVWHIVDGFDKFMPAAVQFKMRIPCTQAESGFGRLGLNRAALDSQVDLYPLGTTSLRCVTIQSTSSENPLPPSFTFLHRLGNCESLLRAQAPNLEKLASESMVFNNTYVQQAVCGPSRNSFMTGKRSVGLFHRTFNHSRFSSMFVHQFHQNASI
jgi:hypothetical protein